MSPDGLKKIVARYWGYESLRPLQEPAMQAVLQGRDSLVVLPTGGGKSLCYQAPAVLRGDTTVVLSPLISLMKDQVDGLRACGISSLQIDSSQSPEERFATEQKILTGKVPLVFISPERLVGTDFYRLLQRIQVRTFAIDEAHCISHWGHDFRPEYRQLQRLREFFPDASVHAYTATATEQVREDIINQLHLKNPEVLVGFFDRPNLTYRVLTRLKVEKQVVEIIDRHTGEAGIIYCIRRRDVDHLSQTLQKRGYQALPYHAGLSAEERRGTQEAFSRGKCDLVVATVAFGMGIDRSNIRFVLHTGMPKSIEHYQQETGRAGRDGLEAECVLLYSGADFLTWKYIVEKSGMEADADPSYIPHALGHLEDMDRYCGGAVCRHHALVKYFGQSLDTENCGACDLCLGDVENVQESTVVTQKILSCVARVKERFGVMHIVAILRGESTDGVRKWGHEKLSTFGLLQDQKKSNVRDWIYQLIGQGVLVQEGADYPVLRLNAASWEILRGTRTVRLIQSVRRSKEDRPKKSKSETISWEGVDRELFSEMRDLRLRLAQERRVPPYHIFNDATLRELARVRPHSLEKMGQVYGIGEVKLRDFGAVFLEEINRRQAERNQDHLPEDEEVFELFRKKQKVTAIMKITGRSREAVFDNLREFIRREKPASLDTWVSAEAYQRVVTAARKLNTLRPEPLMVHLGNGVAEEDLRVIVVHLAIR